VFNFAAVFLGFGLLMTSHVPPLIRFGVLITVSIAVSFLASLTVLPALLMVVKPSFLTGHRPAKPRSMTTIIAGSGYALYSSSSSGYLCLVWARRFHRT